MYYSKFYHAFKTNRMAHVMRCTVPDSCKRFVPYSSRGSLNKDGLCSHIGYCDINGTLLVFFFLTNLLLKNLVISHLCNSVCSFCAFTAVGPSNTNSPIFIVLLSPHPDITSQSPNPNFSLLIYFFF